MKKCKELKLFSKEIIIDIIVSCIIATFIYMLNYTAGGNLVISFLTAVNRNLIEYIKILLITAYIVELAKMWILEERKYNLWSAIFFKIISQIISGILIFLLFNTILGIEYVLIDLVIMYFSIILSEVIQYIIQSKIKVSSNVEDVYKYLNLLVIIVLVCSYIF